MTLYNALILGIIQGLTEFLPISSSGHLVLMERYIGIIVDPQALQSFDIVLHAGSLFALLIYFRQKWIKMIISPLARQKDGSPPMLLLLIVASIPIGIVGFLGASWVAHSTRSPVFVAFGFFFTGTFLIASSWYENRFASRSSCGFKQAIGASFGQALAIFPGFSRSGLTMASARLMGLSAHSAAEFAFLLAVPALSGALLHTLLSGNAIEWLFLNSAAILVGFTASFIASIAVMHFFLVTVRRYGLWMWAVYLFTAGALVLADEMMLLIHALPNLLHSLDLSIVIGTVFVALILESTIFTSFFVPGIASLVILIPILKSDISNIFACIPIATTGIILGSVLMYIPSRQARRQVRWKLATDRKLSKLERIMHRRGILIVFFGGWYPPIRPWVSIAAGLANMHPATYMVSMSAGSLTLVTSIILITLYAPQLLLQT